MRKKTTQKTEKSKTLLIEKDKLSNVKEQRKALEKTFQGLEGFIAVAKSKLKELKVKIVDSNNLLKLKEKEVGLNNKKIAIAKNNFNSIENKILKLDNDRKIKEVDNEEDFLILDEKLDEIKNNIAKQNSDFDKSKKTLKNEENEIKKEIKQKIFQSEQLDVDIEDKESKISELKETAEIKNSEKTDLNFSIKIKKKAIEELKEGIDTLEKKKSKKQDQVKIINSELVEIEKEKVKKDKELESTKGKISLILRKEAVNNMKEKKLKEEYKKIGL